MINSRLVLISLSLKPVYQLHFCHACLNLLMDELAVAQCSSFVKHHEWIPSMYFVAMFECCSIISLMHLDGYLLFIADQCHICCLPFPNRASDSGDLYIDYNRNHLTFPVAPLDFQVEARFNHSLSNHAYASHTACRIFIPCSCVGCLLCCVSLSGVCFFGLVPVTLHL